MENIKTWYEDKSGGGKNWDIHLGSNLHLKFSILLVLIYLLTEIVSNFENTNYIRFFLFPLTTYKHRVPLGAHHAFSN